MWYIINFIFGIILGSFINVIIYRSVEGIKIYDPPRSFCPNCKRTIKWYDNIPILSYIILRGKCRYCNQKIPFRYFFVELITGLAFLSHSVFFSFYDSIILNLIFFAIIPVIYIDFKIMMIPDFSWIILWFASLLHIIKRFEYFYLDIISLIMVTFIFLILKKIYTNGLGEGDIYLAAPFSFLLGLPLSIYYLLISSILSLLYVLIKRKKIIPFGPFLSISGYLMYMFMLKYY